ncbi:dienelactone hydrolase family protein [Henriciella sp. AS95]|uniref:alpha/beta hydrolase n=1 Tax=Henriciella sp. AS95 TaxID=3135782 RepID=UPI00317DBC24
MKRWILGLALALIWTGPAAAQTADTAPTAQIVPAVPGQQIYLPTVDETAPDTEQWNRVFGQVWVRNVSKPSLYPVMPKNGRGNGQAVIIMPGGGFSFVSIESEGFWVAERLAAEGYTAFVLKYRPRPTPEAPDAFLVQISREFQALGRVEERLDPAADTPVHARDIAYEPAADDLAAAIALVQSRADEWGLAPDQIGVIGFSAGAMASIQLIEDYEEASALAHVGLIYPPMWLSIEGGPRPDLFFAIAVDDPLFARNDLSMVQAWLKQSDDVEFHLYSGGGHGFGMRPQGTTSDLWIEQYLAWLAAR